MPRFFGAFFCPLADSKHAPTNRGIAGRRPALPQLNFTFNMVYECGGNVYRNRCPSAAADFVTVDCAGCGGMLKPDVVFFGESVPAPRVQQCFDLVETATALVVLGSSLTVMSGRRFVVQVDFIQRGASVMLDDFALVPLSPVAGWPEG